MSDNAQLLQLAIATPLVAALVIALGLPKRFATKLALVAFVVPALIALWLWKAFPAEGAQHYSYLSSVDTGLSSWGINLKLGLNGIALPMFLLAASAGVWLFYVQHQFEVRLALWDDERRRLISFKEIRAEKSAGSRD